MKKLLEIKEKIITFYLEKETYLLPILKFFTAFIVFSFINAQIGYDARLKNILLVMVLALVSAFTPNGILVALAAILSFVHIYSISPVLAAIVSAVVVILYLLFIRLTPRYGLVLIALPILYTLKIPYLIPILLGLIATPLMIVTAGCGVIIYYLFLIVKDIATSSGELLDDIMLLYKYIIDGLLNNKDMMISVVVFAIIILVTYTIRRLKINYAFEFAILAGVLTSIVAFLISMMFLKSNIEIFWVVFGSLIAGCIVYIIQFFYLSLDYTAVENLQFQDDEYYYYVRAVPKLKIAMEDKNIKEIRKSENSHSTYKRYQAKSREDEDDFLDER